MSASDQTYRGDYAGVLTPTLRAGRMCRAVFSPSLLASAEANGVARGEAHCLGRGAVLRLFPPPPPRRRRRPITMHTSLIQQDSKEQKSEIFSNLTEALHKNLKADRRN
jgi:hypothetical protein